jgi:hypothetical protein
MEFRASNKWATAGATVVLIVGFAVIAYSTRHGNVAGSIGGACLILCALTLIALVLIKRWVCNTSEERRIYGAATQAAQNAHTRYIACQAALENEQGRLNRDMAAERARIAAQLIAEREKMARDFKEERATLAAEAFRTGAEMERAGMLRPEAAQPANLIHFPRDLPQQQREHSREHGVVGP